MLNMLQDKTVRIPMLNTPFVFDDKVFAPVLQQTISLKKIKIKSKLASKGECKKFLRCLPKSLQHFLFVVNMVFMSFSMRTCITLKVKDKIRKCLIDKLCEYL